MDQDYNRYLAERLVGVSVLDIGCGYGSLVDFLGSRGKKAVGVDPDSECITTARRLFPGRDYLLGRFEGQFPDHSFDHVVMKDALHHVLEEGDLDATLAHIRRVLRPAGTLVVFDPNIHFILRLCRKIMLHQDAECSIENARIHLAGKGFSECAVDFYDLFALPASGGYVGICFVPPVSFVQQGLIRFNRMLSRVVARTALARIILWRYCLVTRIAER